MAGLAYVNGRIGPIEDAVVSIEDRGLQFGHSVYEVVHAVHGAYFRLWPHLARLERSLQAVGIPLPAPMGRVAEEAQRLLGMSGEPEGALYIQVTAGTLPRQHVPSSPTPPTLIMTLRPHVKADHGPEEDGIGLITFQDLRWARRDVKATTLLANVLMRQEAVRQGAYEALLYEPDGVITECSAANFFALLDGCLRTHPASEKILHGVTRAAVIEVSASLALECREVPIHLNDLPRVTEAFITGTVLGIAPVRRIDHTWHRSAGQTTRRLQDAYADLIWKETKS